ncbi:16S rRNA (uracil(1498)-N(3))-methyltransferase [Pontibacterium granulatum]|uniref:16S rRNA (uracil(1498)-N(3))-methyltransferase n=1 Tax=Pontibacterium granulatum TaxID=2036029 RepID=UPI00249A7124|nr:16S rRNA (uracil(1498)-N(3))-methyltransferase [Pontibacterium granulatum]MDI3324658.1 16S rRNA (uracil(1498)-N(3))-methyltransferase [Pontibacterium granulatum]
MRIPRFYDDQPLAAEQVVELSDAVVQHVCRALRMRVGDPIVLFNGDGNEYHAQLESVEKRRASVRILKVTQPAVESPLQIRIGQSLSRGERMDYAVQKATEMGMQRMFPLFSERCEVKLNNERQDKRIRHWQQVAISACEQSGRCAVPTINAPQTLEQWVQQEDAELKLVLHHHTATPLGAFTPPQSVALLIGPEGGLTEEEVELARDHGFQPVAFGPRVMRTETAPVAALALLQHLWGDWR